MKLPFDLRALWERAQAWYRDHSPRDQRIILGVLVAAALSLVYVGIVEPVLDFREAIAQEIADGQEELERSMRFLAAKDARNAERDELRKRLTQAKSRLLPGGTATLGAAALQERANALASEKGITVQSTQVMKEDALDPFRRVSIRLSLSGELKPLAELLAGLEFGQQLAIPFIEVNRRGAVAGAKGPRTLSATIEVAGFVQGGAKVAEGEGTKGAEAEGAKSADADGTKAIDGEGTKGAEAEGAKGPDGETASASETGDAAGEGPASDEGPGADRPTTTTLGGTGSEPPTATTTSVPDATVTSTTAPGATSTSGSMATTTVTSTSLPTTTIAPPPPVPPRPPGRPAPPEPGQDGDAGGE